MRRTRTSWGHVSQWYADLLKEQGTYQKELILPNLLRAMSITPGERILDLACGPGFFAVEFFKAGAVVTGVDISEELIGVAKRESPPQIKYYVGSADDLSFLPTGSFDKVALVLAVQNIENVHGTFEECSRVLRNGGKLYIVMNHPAFRIPGASSWGWDQEKGIMYRRVDKYLSEISAKIVMHPGENPREYTLSFHRPLQYYFKLFPKYGFCVTRLEEWNSHRQSQPGPRAEAENRARKEIPLFMMLEATAHMWTESTSLRKRRETR